MCDSFLFQSGGFQQLRGDPSAAKRNILSGLN
jgi:hypothetical protein